MLNTVVVVDDSETDLLFARIMLERAGVAAHLELFDSAQEALNHLCSARGSAGVDLVLLDINMPGMDGFEFLAAYETHTQCRAPVVMLSSSPDPADRLRALQHRCVRSYVTKPLTVDAAAQLPALATAAPPA